MPYMTQHMMRYITYHPPAWYHIRAFDLGWYRCLQKRTLFTWAVALQCSSRNCFPPPGLVLGKLVVRSCLGAGWPRQPYLHRQRTCLRKIFQGLCPEGRRSFAGKWVYRGKRLQVKQAYSRWIAEYIDSRGLIGPSLLCVGSSFLHLRGEIPQCEGNPTDKVSQDLIKMTICIGLAVFLKARSYPCCYKPRPCASSPDKFHVINECEY